MRIKYTLMVGIFLRNNGDSKMSNVDTMIAKYTKWGYDKDHTAIILEQNKLEYDRKYLRSQYSDAEFQHLNDCLTALDFLEQSFQRENVGA